MKDIDVIFNRIMILVVFLLCILFYFWNLYQGDEITYLKTQLKNNKETIVLDPLIIKHIKLNNQLDSLENLLKELEK